MPWLSAATSSCITSYTILQFTAKNMASELFKPPIEMMANISQGLFPFLCDLGQCVAFKKVKLERLPLILRQTGKHLAKPGLPDHSFESSLICRRCLRSENDGFTVSIHRR